MKKLALSLLIACVISTASAVTDFTQVAREAIPAVVSIKTKFNAGKSNQEQLEDLFGENDLFKHFFGFPNMPREQSPQMGQASGFVITPNGFIVTNCHVVKDADEIQVTLNDGREFTANLVGSDPNTDIAVIKIEGQNVPHLSFGDSEALEVGQPVAAIGNPLGLQASLTSGVISAKGRNDLDITRVEDFIQTDAAINRGNSGGPLLNLDSQVIGMNTAIVSPTGGNMGIGFAIPSSMLKHVVAQIQDTGSVSRGFMGVALQPVDKEIAAAFDLADTQGALVAELSPDSPAATAGIQQGDVLLKCNGATIKNVGTLRTTISMMQPGTKVNFSVRRNDQNIDIPVTVGEFPSETQATPTHEQNLGMQVEPITPETARKLNLNQQQGVIVSRVDQNSVAAWAGIKKGALILEVNKQKIGSIDDFKNALKSTPTNKPTLFLVKQGDITRYLGLSP